MTTSAKSVTARTATTGHAWLPTSPCGPACTSSDRPPTVPWSQRWVRLLRALAVVVRGSSLFARTRWFSTHNRARIARRWSCLLLAAMGIRLDVHGWAAEDRGPIGTLYVANHISWVDNLALIAVRPLPAVAKREVGNWPVIGRLCRRLGTVFIDRANLRALPRDVAAVTDLLRSGRGVVVTPEGTTWCGATMGRFRPAMFQAAIDAQAPVRPLAIRYRTTDGTPTCAAAFVGTESLVRSLWRVLGVRGLVVEVHVLPVLAAGSVPDRRSLATLAEYSVAAVTEQRAPVVAGHRPPRRVARRRRPPVAAELSAARPAA